MDNVGNCFAFNIRSQECECLKKKKCVGFGECVFYKPQSQAIAEAVNSLANRWSRPYTKEIRAVVKMINRNQIGV